MTDLLDVEKSNTGIAVKTWILFMYHVYRDLNNQVSLSNQAKKPRLQKKKLPGLWCSYHSAGFGFSISPLIIEDEGHVNILIACVTLVT